MNLHLEGIYLKINLISFFGIRHDRRGALLHEYQGLEQEVEGERIAQVCHRKAQAKEEDSQEQKIRHRVSKIIFNSF